MSEELIEQTSSALVNDDGVFIYNDNQPISYDIVAKFLRYHIQNPSQLHRFKRLKRYYKGQHDYADYSINPAKSAGKPDARMSINYPAELVDNMTGFFAGTPPTINYNPAGNEDTNSDFDKEIQNKLSDFLTINHVELLINELAKQTDIYGRSYLLLYQDEHKQTRLAVSDPTQTFVIYDNTIEMNPICAVRYQVFNNTLATSKGTIYFADKEVDFTTDVAGSTIATSEPTEYAYQLGSVPMIEFINNNERLGTFEPVIGLIDQVDAAMNHKANDIDYFANEILKIVGAMFDQDTINEMIDKRIINVPTINGSVDISFLDKPNADTLQENFLKRADSYIYTKSGVANYNDDVFGKASGVALEFKLQAMTNKAKTKQRFFKKQLLEMLKMAFNVGGTLPQILSAENNIMNDIDITFSPTVPHNLADEANTAKTLMGITDQKTALSTLSVVTDPQQVIDARNAENKQRQQDMLDAVNADE